MLNSSNEPTLGLVQEKLTTINQETNEELYQFINKKIKIINDLIEKSKEKEKT